MPRLRARVDKNQKEIVETLRQEGATVFPTHQLGKGFPDLVVGYAGKNLLIEVKSKKGKHTEDERQFFLNWCGKVWTVRSSEDAKRLLKKVTETGHFI